MTTTAQPWNHDMSAAPRDGRWIEGKPASKDYSPPKCEPPSPEPVETPRTDACQGSDGTIPECEELCILARALETELATALRERDEALKLVNYCGEHHCDECDGTGWKYNRVEGRHPCVCMTEAEPYQLILADRTTLRAIADGSQRTVAALETTLVTLRAAIADAMKGAK